MPKSTEEATANTPTTKETESRRDNELEHQEWYHGIRPRRDIVNLLRNPGDWLVRATDARLGTPEIVISTVNDKRDLIHYTLKYDVVNNVWHLGVVKNISKAPKFKTVVQLVEYYKEKSLPGKSRLKKAILRPQWLIKHDKVSFDRKKDLLGSGNFCHVYKGVYSRSSEEKITVAIKICHEGRSSDKEVAEGREARNQMLAEAQLMAFYVHKHVIQFYGVACDHPPVLIVMEFCSGGNLEKHLQTYGDKISDGEKINYALQAGRGMRYLHEQKCVHRDLAARNCLISSHGRIKISDFGLSQLVRDEKDKTEEEKVEHSPQLPIRWMAPESLTRPIKFSYKTDVWSYGVLLYEIFNNGVKPWPNEVPKKIATMIRRGRMLPMPERTPADMKEIVEKIWVVDPEKRPTMAQTLVMVSATSKKLPPPPIDQMLIYSVVGVERTRADTDETVDVDEDPTPLGFSQDDEKKHPEPSQSNDDKNQNTTVSIVADPDSKKRSASNARRTHKK